MTDDSPMDTTPPDPFTCPVCESCDHDLRGGLLDLAANILENFKAATETLIDGMEADGSGATELAESLTELASVRTQISALMSAVPDIMVIKAAHAEKKQ